MLQDLYKELPLKSFSSWFTELAVMAQDSKDHTNLPKLELLLRNGQTIRGFIIKENKSTLDQQLMVLEPGDPYSKSEIICLSASEVIGIRVTEVEKYLKGVVASSPPRAVGSLEFRRSLKSIENEIEKSVAENIEVLFPESLTDNERGVVLTIAELLPPIFERLTSDELGKKLIKESIQKIRLSISGKAETYLKEGKLDILIGTPLELPASKEKERLLLNIEALL